MKYLLHFKPLIYNSKVEILTDNKNLLSKGPLAKRLNRMKFIIEEYDYELHHIDGKANVAADILSRCLYNIKALKGKNDYRTVLPEGIIKFGENFEDNKKKLSPEEFEYLRNEIKNIHDEMLHPGISKMIITLNRYIKTPDMNKMIGSRILNSPNKKNNPYGHDKKKF
ncbi:Retrovirus-related Pol polyprotein from transposon [Dictyocoela roeselum]|nr:Retrovirus-related Pol polyprotein from transposon [Dictyocoela roeselum]